ncbi:BTAD domain-containing putative transcriptional regulator [Kibdelosporangium persicum]|uniref:DNA-binding transcriptional activator of the SARP family n=1 Tax=Kibdelosporangium persicum TaxID=2698649 RepID=A0ABX2F4U0_9PSEU|nr:BTAD domain-containing putative transcriptional regulator [Kibdelosporangium persicum]NRN65863.1 DNA-binding transcriptional activator of the SARP family [Kibdelosporangium persicum]
MEFRVLGPIEVVAGGRVIPIGSARLRCLLAALLVRANKVVRFDELVEAVWGESVPANPRPAVYTLVTRLRSVLKDIDIEAGGDGYRIVVDEGQVDVKRFEGGIAAARTAGEGETEVLRQALELWRGEPFADVPSDYLRRMAEPLAERRLQALERKLELDLNAGQHQVALPELTELTAEYPLRERFWALLMLALFRAGRQAEALRAYSAVRQRLVDELGVEPGAHLRKAHEIVLAGEEDSGWRVECQLPIDIGDFTNRDDELAHVLESMRPGTTVPIMTISGPPGMGKSALVVRAAHRLIEQYPDGQWFLRLKGASPAPRPANDLLAELLRTAGVDPTSIPADVDARASLLRSRLAERRVLIVLDDAAGVEQVAPLLPGRPGSAVLVTSRSELGGLSVLYGGNRISLQPFSGRHAYDLLARIAGRARCAEDIGASTVLTDLCGRMPLALRIAASNLASRPGLRIARYAEDLRSGDRLAKLKTSGIGIRAVFDGSFATLSEVDQRAFGLLGVVPGMDISVAGAAALLECDIDEAGDILERLVAANLLERQAEDRFRFHDLIRVYAAARANDYDSAEALRRLADWYLYSVYAAVAPIASVYVSRLGPAPADVVPLVFETTDEAMRWLDAERHNYMALIEHTAAYGPLRYAWQLTDAARPDLYHSYRTDDLNRMAGLGLAAARQVGDQRGQAIMFLVLGSSKAVAGHFDESVDDFAECRRIAAVIGETGIYASAVLTTAVAYHEAGWPQKAVEAAEEGRELVDRGVEQGEQRKLAVLSNLGVAYYGVGRLRDALETLVEARELAIRLEVPTGEIVTCGYLSQVHRELGDADQALAVSRFVLESTLARYYAHDPANIMIARVHCDRGETELARTYAITALEGARSRGYRKHEAEAAVVLGTICLAEGQRELALSHFRQALDLVRGLVAYPVEVEALAGMTLASGTAGFAEKAVALAREHGMRLLEAKALAALAEVKADQGDSGEALAAAGQALEMFREFGCRRGERHAGGIVGRVKGN